MTENFGSEPAYYGDSNNANATPLSRSYSSAISAISNNNASASSSKAVLAALRALQDKIRCLEAERSQAFDESTQLRHTLKNQEIEAEHTKQKETLAVQRTLQEVKLNYDKVLSDKATLEIELSKLEDKNRSDNHILEDLKRRVLDLEEEKRSSVTKIKELEDAHAHLEDSMKFLQYRERELQSLLDTEGRRHQEDISSLASRLKAAQDDLSGASLEKSLADRKLAELDQLVGQLLSVNDTLVTQLTGRPTKPTIKSKKSIAPKGASATKLARAAPAVAHRTGSSITGGTDGLRSVHSMYAEIAAGILDARLSSIRKPATKNAAAVKKSKPVTRLKKKKEAAGERGASFSFGPLLGTGVGDSEEQLPSDVQIRVPSVSFSRDYSGMSMNNDTTSTRSYAVASNGSSQQYSATPSNYPSSSSGYPAAREERPASASTTASTSRPPPPPEGSLQQVIASLEEEFSQLNEHYRGLLSSVKTQSASSESRQAEELVAVIQKLHKKGEQLRALKSPTR